MHNPSVQCPLYPSPLVKILYDSHYTPGVHVCSPIIYTHSAAELGCCNSSWKCVVPYLPSRCPFLCLLPSSSFSCVPLLSPQNTDGERRQGRSLENWVCSARNCSNFFISLITTRQQSTSLHSPREVCLSIFVPPLDFTLAQSHSSHVTVISLAQLTLDLSPQEW